MKVNFKSFLFSSAIAITFSACYYDNIEDLHPAPVIIPGVNDTNTNGCDTAKAITYTADLIVFGFTGGLAKTPLVLAA